MVTGGSIVDSGGGWNRMRWRVDGGGEGKVR